MAGVSLPVEATGAFRGPVTRPEGVEQLSLSLEATVDRTAFGMGWQMELPGRQAGARPTTSRLLVELELLKELTAMRILAISGSLRARLPQRAPAPPSWRSRRRRASRSRSGTGSQSIPPYDEDDDTELAPAPGRRARASDRRRRRPPLRHARIQLVDPRRAQERDRLGIAPPRDDAAPGQARRRHRRDHRAASAPSGRRPSSARSSAPPAPASSTSTSVALAHDAFDADGR